MMYKVETMRDGTKRELKTKRIDACVTPSTFEAFNALRLNAMQLNPEAPQSGRLFSESGFATLLIDWAIKNFDPSVIENVQNVKDSNQ